MNEDENIFEEPEFQAERAVGERVGYNRPGFEFLELDIGIDDDVGKHLQNINKRLSRQNMSDEDRFKSLVLICFNQYKSKLKISDKELGGVAEIINNVKNIKYKNPIAFLFGYAIIVGNKIDKKKFGRVSKINVSGVTPVDIIRYARMIININK